jgi:hypothetical protein
LFLRRFSGAFQIAVAALVEFHSGETDVVRSVDALQPFGALVSALDQRYRHEGRVVRNVTFIDDDEDEEGGGNSYPHGGDGNGGNDYRGDVTATVKQQPIAGQQKVAEPIWMDVLRENTEKRMEGYLVASVCDSSWYSSLWSMLASKSHYSNSSSNSSSSSTAAKKPELVLDPRESIMESYQDIVGFTINKLSQYWRVENRAKLAVKVSHFQFFLLC